MKSEYFLLLGILLIVGCGQQSSTSAVTRTTVGDTLIVVNTPSGEPVQPPYSFERDLVIGVAEGDEPYMLVSSGRLAVDENGRIYSGEQRHGEVRIFNADGTFSHRFGRRGEGPGEFSANTFFYIHPLKNGDVAVDDIPFQLEIFDDSGSYRRSIDLRLLPSKAEQEGYWNSSVRWLFNNRILLAWRKAAFGQPTHHWFLIINEELENQTWINAAVTPPSTVVDGQTMYSVPFPVFLDWTMIGDNILVWCIDNQYKFTRYDLSNDSWMHIHFELPPTPFSSRDREEYIAREIENLPGERKNFRETMLRKAPFPSHYPQITELIGDDEGRLWVCRYIAEPWLPHPEGFQYDLFNDQGEWVGTVTAPRRFEVIKDGYAYAHGWEEYPTIERYRILSHK